MYKANHSQHRSYLGAISQVIRVLKASTEGHEACFSDKLNNEVTNHYFRLIQRPVEEALPCAQTIFLLQIGHDNLAVEGRSWP